jgi:protein O-mannosyl-transferase
MSARSSTSRGAGRRKPSRPAAASGTPQPGTWLRALLIVVAGALVYANSLSGPFILDDTVSIVENASIRDLSNPALLAPQREVPTAGRPIVTVLLAINYALSGLDVRGYHLWNLGLHLLCGLLVFACIRRTLELPQVPDRWRKRSSDVGFAAAALWTLHPLNSEVVDYLTQRTESTMAAFYLLAIYANARSIQSVLERRWQALAALACAFGMACKESMVTVPVAIVAYDAVFVFGSLRLALRTRLRYYAVLTGSWLVLASLLAGGPRVHSAGFSMPIGIGTYLLNQCVMIARYLRLAVWPSSLVVFYGEPRTLTLLDVAPQAALVVAVAILTLVALRRSPILGFAGAWFFITLAPTSSVVPIATEVGAERRMYLPLVALAALAAAAAFHAAERLRIKRRAAIATLVVAASALATLTVLRNREYRSALELARTVVARWPTPAAEAMLGQELAIAGRRDEAIVHLRAAAPQYTKAHYYLGGELFNAGRLEEAMPELEAFLRQAPHFAEAVRARLMLGRVLMARKEWPRAEGEFRQVVKMAPPQTPIAIDAIGFLADALVGQERFTDAAAIYERYLAETP